MSEEIGIGLIIGAITASSIYIWNSKDFTQPQKIFLLSRPLKTVQQSNCQ